MTEQELLQTFLQGAGLHSDDEESLAIGCLTPANSPAGIDAVMEKHTKQIDTILQTLPETHPDKQALFSIRGFAFTEYQDLFNVTISEQSFIGYPIFRFLGITRERERKRFIYNLSKDRYEDYFDLLTKSLLSYGIHGLLSFFFTESNYRPYISKKPRCTLFDSR